MNRKRVEESTKNLKQYKWEKFCFCLKKPLRAVFVAALSRRQVFVTSTAKHFLRQESGHVMNDYSLVVLLISHQLLFKSSIALFLLSNDEGCYKEGTCLSFCSRAQSSERLKKRTCTSYRYSNFVVVSKIPSRDRLSH